MAGEMRQRRYCRRRKGSGAWGEEETEPPRAKQSSQLRKTERLKKKKINKNVQVKLRTKREGKSNFYFAETAS